MTAIAVRARRVALPDAGATVALLVVVGAGVFVALAAAAGDDAYLVPALVRARAGWLPGPLAGVSVATSLGDVFFAVAVMTVGYAAVVALAPRLTLRRVLVAVAVLDAVFLLAPPLFSTDVFNYVDVAQLTGRFGLDPYVAAPAAGPHTGLYVFLHWRHAVTVYGPLFTVLARLLGHATVSQAVLAFKACAAAAAFGCTVLVAWIAGRRGASPARAAAAFGLNPLVLVWTVGGAHNDALMVLGLLGGVALMTAGTAAPARTGPPDAGAAPRAVDAPATGAALVVAGAAVKLSAGLALPFLVWGAGRGRRLRALAGAAGAAAIVVALAYVAFPDHAGGMLSGLQRQQGLDSIASVPTEVALALGLPGVTALETTVIHILLALWLGTCGVLLLRGGDAVALAGWALLGVVMASTWLLPWYLVWPLALAAAAADRRLLIATCAVGAAYVIGHVPLT
ncbi:MAG: alpha,6-mannosyltransferase [Solirubrobacteraceae bacterium]|jgi:alpha-1,6-mannosyltransferase|nr:alpha,6-mannosyltransferase [Solirubrobacteraceae bacterium]